MLEPKQFIIEEFKKRKERNVNYSLRAFANWLKVSPAQLSQIMTGKRPITLKTMKKINDRLGLSPRNSQQLIQKLLNQKNIINPTQVRSISELNEDQFHLISDWYHLAILSLTKVKGSSADPRWIARRLGIKFDEAHQAILRLERLGILQTKPVFKQIVDPFEIVSNVPSAAIRKYHKQSLELAIEKMETVDINLRQFQSISMPLNPDLVKILKTEIDQLLANATEASKESIATEVYNLNVQLYPVTTIQKSLKEKK